MSIERARDLFVKTFDHEPEFLAVAPGRVNLIGEHTDYNGGYVFPAAIDRCLYIAADRTDGPMELVSQEQGRGQTFDASSAEPGLLTDWSRYPAGVAWAFRKNGLPIVNLRASVVSDIPVGSGVSSSAAIEMAFAVLWREVGHLDLTGTDLAKLGKECENKFVGVQSGIMDQMASANGRDGHAMFLDTKTLEIRYAPIPDGVSVVLCDTGKRRDLKAGEEDLSEEKDWYNNRTRQCAEAAKAIGVELLRDATPEMIEAAKWVMSDLAYRRAKHVTTEDERCLRFAEALEAGDLTLVGRLMKESHLSLQYDYEVSCPELDRMAEAAWNAPGCIGARMTGAGFGGACVALVHTDQLPAFEAYTLPKYQQHSRFSGALMACGVVDGARLLECSG